jgi:hypothetical protein
MSEPDTDEDVTIIIPARVAERLCDVLAAWLSRAPAPAAPAAPDAPEPDGACSGTVARAIDLLRRRKGAALLGVDICTELGIDSATWVHDVRDALNGHPDVTIAGVTRGRRYSWGGA